MTVCCKGWGVKNFACCIHDDHSRKAMTTRAEIPTIVMHLWLTHPKESTFNTPLWSHRNSTRMMVIIGKVNDAKERRGLTDDEIIMDNLTSLIDADDTERIEQR